MQAGALLRELPSRPVERVKPLVPANMAGRDLMVARPCPKHGMGAVVVSAKPNTVTRVFSNSEAIDFVAEALKRDPAKQIARKIVASPRTVEGWKARKVAMSLPHFLTAIQVIPELRAEVGRLIGMGGEGSPEFARALSDLLSAALKGRP